MNRKAASKRIDQLLRDYRGSTKDVMTDPDYPPDDPHNIPGVYFIVEFRGWGHGGVSGQVKIGRSDDPRLTLANLQTGNSAELDLVTAVLRRSREHGAARSTLDSGISVS